MQSAGFLQLSHSKVFSLGSKKIAAPTLADVYVLAQKVRSQIEETLLLPIAEIDNRSPIG